jgi:hypothetical protein
MIDDPNAVGFTPTLEGIRGYEREAPVRGAGRLPDPLVTDLSAAVRAAETAAARATAATC